MRSLRKNHATEKPQNTAGSAEDLGVAVNYARQHQTGLARVGDSPMTIEENKKIASEFAARFSANDMAGALDMIADDVTWWIPGKPGHVPGAGVFTKEQVAELFRRMAEQFPSGLQMTIKSMIAEGEKVAVELESYGELPNGRVYNNEYHMLLTIRGGKIRAMREYHDTQHKVATFFGP